MGLERIRTNDDGEHVQFRPDAAASFGRMEAQQGRQLDVNRTVVERSVQADLYAKRQRGQYPYPVAHPDKSDHVYRSDTDGGNAWDTDERGDWLDDNGWIADVDGEPWHRRYVPARDNHRNDPTPAAPAAPADTEDTMKPFLVTLPNGRWATVFPQGNGKPRAVTLQGNAAARAIALWGEPVPFDEQMARDSLSTAVDGV